MSLTLELFKSQLYLLFTELDFIGDEIWYTNKLNSSLTQLSDGGAGIPAQEIKSFSLVSTILLLLYGIEIKWK